MAVFVGYSDESEIDPVLNPQGEFFFGGYVANVTDWPCVAGAWQDRVLDGPPKIPYLHMRKRGDEWRREHKISFNDLEQRVSEAARVMKSFGNMAVIASTIRRADLEDLFHTRYRHRKNVPIGLREPDYLCFLAYAVHMLRQVRDKWPETKQLNFIVDRKKEVSHHVGTFNEELKSLLDPPYQNLVGDLLPVSMEEQNPLQAADVFLWHLQRYYAAGRDQMKMDVCDRVRLADLIQNGKLDGAIHSWQRDELEEMANRWQKAGLIPKRKDSAN